MASKLTAILHNFNNFNYITHPQQPAVKGMKGCDWLSAAGSVYFQLQRACLPSEGAFVAKFLKARKTSWAKMSATDQIALINWVNEQLEQQPPSWEQSAEAVAIMARNRFEDWKIPNVWDRRELWDWREKRWHIEESDLVDLCSQLESEWEAIRNG